MVDEGKAREDGVRRRFKIFLSSTSEDLEDYRAQVVAAISRLQQESVRMETAEPQAPLATCRKRVRAADAPVLIVGHRYGWVPGGEAGGDGTKSITWYEVETALDADKPVFAFLVDPAHPWSGDREELRLAAAETDEQVREVVAAVRGLKEFKAFLEKEVTRAAFTTPEDLAAKVTSSLHPCLLEQALDDHDKARVAEAVAEVDLTAYLEDLLARL